MTRQQRAWRSGQMSLVIRGDELALPEDMSWINPSEPSRLCLHCGRVVPGSCFRADKAYCTICDEAIRLARIEADPWSHRAADKLRRHMRKEREQALHACETLKEYETLTGVTVAWLADEMRKAWETGSCQHCASAGRAALWKVICPDPVRDLSDMTVDRTDRSRRLARDNMTLMCHYGNTAKGRSSPGVQNDRDAYWRIHHAGKS
jgi:hypothetical protein